MLLLQCVNKLSFIEQQRMRGLPNYSRHFKMETKKKIVTPQQGTGN
jgi:hypothetical protein